MEVDRYIYSLKGLVLSGAPPINWKTCYATKWIEAIFSGGSEVRAE